MKSKGEVKGKLSDSLLVKVILNISNMAPFHVVPGRQFLFHVQEPTYSRLSSFQVVVFKGCS